MKTLKQLLYAFIFSIFLVNPNWSQVNAVSVKKIVEHPDIYYTAYIETEGFIIHYKPETSTSTSYYLLMGEYGDTLKVNTAEEKPEINQKYRVNGILYKERIIKNGKVIYRPFLSEKSKICLTCPTPPPGPNIVEGQGFDSRIYYIIGGAAGLLLIGLFAFVKIRNKNNHQPTNWESENLTTDYSQIPKTQEVPPPYNPPYPDEEFKTIKIDTTPSKTMRLIPGRLEIINGEDKGKTFLIQGYPTKEGSIVTIGREVVSGERKHSHIQIDQHYQTVSRKQAEIIYYDKKLYLRNLSETNITEVDGHELGLGEKVELKPNSIIKMGEIEFQYKV